MSDEILEIIRESFVQPNVLPPFRADEISKPLMGEFVGYGRGYALNRTIWRDIVLNEKRALPKMDKTSINTTFNAFVKLKIQDGGYRFRQIRKKKKKTMVKKATRFKMVVCAHTLTTIFISKVYANRKSVFHNFWKNSSNVLIRTSWITGNIISQSISYNGIKETWRYKQAC